MSTSSQKINKAIRDYRKKGIFVKFDSGGVGVGDGWAGEFPPSFFVEGFNPKLGIVDSVHVCVSRISLRQLRHAVEIFYIRCGKHKGGLYV